MEFLSEVEKKCDEITLKLPRLPLNVKNILVSIAPYLSIASIAFGVIWILGFIVIYVGFFAIFAPIFAYHALTNSFVAWIQILSLLGVIACTIRAIPGLFGRTRNGWLWMFYGQMIMAAGDILTLQIGNLIGLLIGLYFIFQIKENYLTEKK